MSVDTTANDAEIARILAEEFQYESSLFNSDRSEVDDEEEKAIKPSSNQEKNENHFQFDEDSEIAYILQIEEIVLSENHVNHATTKVSDVQLEKTHADMTKALQPTEQSTLMSRILGVFFTIHTRYTTCRTKNQVLVDELRKLSIHLYPVLMSFLTKGKAGISKATVPTLALSLITNVLQGNFGTADVKQIVINMFEMWNESSVWYEFLEQLVYILVAVTIPSCAQGAMDKIMAKISSPN